MGQLIHGWREEHAERTFVWFETSPSDQSQIDWGSFGNWGAPRLYGFALALAYARMRYVGFTQRQDIETLLACSIHGLDEIGYLSLDQLGATCLLELVSQRYERGSMILTINKSCGDWGTIFGDNVIASAILDRLLHHSMTINIKGGAIG